MSKALKEMQKYIYEGVLRDNHRGDCWLRKIVFFSILKSSLDQYLSLEGDLALTYRFLKDNFFSTDF